MNANGESIHLQLDFTTLSILDTLAERWGVSRDVAAERAIRQAAPATGETASAAKIEVLRELQRNLALTSEKASKWQTVAREARR
jgi:chorismate mutase